MGEHYAEVLQIQKDLFCQHFGGKHHRRYERAKECKDAVRIIREAMKTYKIQCT